MDFPGSLREGGIGSIFHHPIGKIYNTYIPLIYIYILVCGGLYATYNLLREPETVIETSQTLSFGYFVGGGSRLKCQEIQVGG